MTTKTLILRRVTRTYGMGQSETLEFESGVNVLVGKPNTGKTYWLTMVDYLLGGTDSALKALGAEMSEKYNAIRAVVEIDGKSHTFERRWKEANLKTRILIDDEAVFANEFSSHLLEMLSIPEVHYPKGDPFSPNTWPTLSWKQLMRHIYRRQFFWSDIADKQYEDDQHACLMLFLGTAEIIYSENYAEFVEFNKRKIVLEQTKDQYGALFGDLYRYVTDEDAIVDPTKHAIDQAMSRIEGQINNSDQRRRAILDDLLGQVKRISSPTHVDHLGREWEFHQARRTETLSLIRKAEVRLSELSEYRKTVLDELGRYKRTHRAVEKLADLQVTNCPVCDQSVRRTPIDSEHCFLCSQPFVNRDVAAAAGEERLRFELAQLEGEQEEVDDLVAAVQRQLDELSLQLQQIDEDLRQIEATLEKERHAAASLLPPELGRLDSDIGAMKERLRLFERMKLLLARQEERTHHIDGIATQIERLRILLDQQSEALDLEEKSDLLSEAMNDYLTALNQEVPATWSQGRAVMRVSKNRFRLEVGGVPWHNKLGGTLRLYLLLAYHYALLSLSNRTPFHYPGLLMLDFPAEIVPGETITDKENFVLTPFVGLLAKEQMRNTQVIAAGAAFEGLVGAHRQELTRVWI